MLAQLEVRLEVVPSYQLLPRFERPSLDEYVGFAITEAFHFEEIGHWGFLKKLDDGLSIDCFSFIVTFIAVVHVVSNQTVLFFDGIRLCTKATPSLLQNRSERKINKLTNGTCAGFRSGFLPDFLRTSLYLNLLRLPVTLLIEKWTMLGRVKAIAQTIQPSTVECVQDLPGIVHFNSRLKESILDNLKEDRASIRNALNQLRNQFRRT